MSSYTDSVRKEFNRLRTALSGAQRRIRSLERQAELNKQNFQSVAQLSGAEEFRPTQSNTAVLLRCGGPPAPGLEDGYQTYIGCRRINQKFVQIVDLGAVNGKALPLGYEEDEFDVRLYNVWPMGCAVLFSGCRFLAIPAFFNVPSIRSDDPEAELLEERAECIYVPIMGECFGFYATISGPPTDIAAPFAYPFIQQGVAPADAHTSDTLSDVAIISGSDGYTNLQDLDITWNKLPVGTRIFIKPKVNPNGTLRFEFDGHVAPIYAPECP